MICFLTAIGLRRCRAAYSGEGGRWLHRAFIRDCVNPIGLNVAPAGPRLVGAFCCLVRNTKPDRFPTRRRTLITPGRSLVSPTLGIDHRREKESQVGQTLGTRWRRLSGRGRHGSKQEGDCSDLLILARDGGHSRHAL
jgi:hypothetical protein